MMKKVWIGSILLFVLCSLFLYAGPQTEEKSQSGPVEIVYLNSHGPQWEDPKIGGKIFADFERLNPGIKVKNESLPFNQFFELVEVKMSAKSAEFDVFNVDAPMVTSYSLRGFIEPFENYIAKEDIPKYWLPSAIQSASFNGKLMSAPKTDSGMMMVYNKKILQEAGVPFPSPDVNARLTWEELLAMAQKCTKVTSGATETWGLIFDQINRAWNILPLPNSLSGQGIGPDGLTAAGYVNSPAWVTAMQFYQDLYNKYGVSPKGPNTDEARELFNAGKVAFTLGDPAVYSRHAQFQDVGYAPIPYFKDGKPVVGCGSWHAAVNAYSNHKPEAAKFLKYITLEQGNDDFLDPQSKIGARIERLERITKGDDDLSKFYNVIYYELKNSAVIRPLTPGYLEWSNYVDAAIEDIRNGADVKGSLDSAASRIDAALRKYRR
jgi:multiple sugar transport system substrate-binding protein